MTALLTDNLPLLAGAPNGIKKLRELILELAVRGKLVAQDPNDEPASELLRRIADEKARWVAEGKIRKQKPPAEVSDDEKPFELPAGWMWTRLGDICLTQTGTTPSKSQSELFGSDVPFIKPGDIYPDQVDYSGEGLSSLGASQSGRIAKAGSLLMVCIGTIGKCNLIERDCSFNQQINSATLYKGLPQYLRVAARSEYFQGKAWSESSSTTIAILNKGKWEAIPLPLPGLNEQHRIVAKVDELMALCDRLEARQADAESAHAQLVQVLLDSLTQASDATDFSTNWQRLAEHFHTLFTTELSIDALKQTLLQLAVMGKLVPQDLSEGLPNLHSFGAKAPKLVDEKVTPYSVPSQWYWINLCNLLEEGRDISYGVIKLGTEPKQGGVPTLRCSDVKPGYIDLRGVRKVAHDIERDYIRTRLRGGEILINIRGTLGGVAVVDKKLAGYNVAREVAVVPRSPNLNAQYLSIAMQSSYFWQRINQQLRGIAYKGLNLGALRLLPIPIPPVAEQHRIVAKVDQLMALCDQLKTRLTQARQLNEQLASTLVERALADDSQQAPVVSDRQVARTLLAAEITHRLHGQRTFGQRKLQKVIYLAEHAARLAAIQGDYLRDAAGPHDRQLMKQIEGELQNRQWYERIERETVGYAYHPLSDAGQHRQVYESTWPAAERATIERVIELMRDWDTDRCEKTVTLYAAWNDFILEGRPVTDEAIVAEVMHRWNDTKLRFSKAEWLAVLAEMKKHEALIPTGFGNRTTGGMLTLPGFE
ncbi:restriction endonuclease subunit S [Pseudomonas borbori]|uniref:Type I restriction enzyme, S subunit n=1 Tax=Pseudomonas borbori TaxID=289003 RepID=A0A1I5U1G3_9PSED|nr:restriction endonuclease subunit S [Pseudomonas borbori]SFP89114.1 type I restriction enzyme, S subunit [Pseudomonas borbori]